MGVEVQRKQIHECLNMQCLACWSAVAHRVWGQGYDDREIALLTAPTLPDQSNATGPEQLIHTGTFEHDVPPFLSSHPWLSYACLVWTMSRVDWYQVGTLCVGRF